MFGCGRSNSQVNTTANTTTAPVSSSSTEAPLSTAKTATSATSSAPGVLTTMDFMMSGMLVPTSLNFVVIPRDQNGQVLDIKGTLSIKLWDSVITSDKINVGTVNPGELLQQWDDVKLDQSQFIENIGTLVSLPYIDFRPLPGSYSFIQMTITANYFTVSSPIQYVIIRYPLNC